MTDSAHTASAPSWLARLKGWFESEDARRLREQSIRTAEELSREVGRAFTEHPATANETYIQHLKFAGMFGLRFIYAGVATVIHAVFPFMFMTAGSKQLATINRILAERQAGISNPNDDRGCGI